MKRADDTRELFSFEFQLPTPRLVARRFGFFGSKETKAFEQPLLYGDTGLRDIAIRKAFYSCALRRLELIHLEIHHIDFDKLEVRVEKVKAILTE